MPDRERSATPVSSDAVDAEFWSIVLQDEEWLQVEFDEITEPAEARISPPRRIAVAADQSSFCREGPSAGPGGGVSRFRDTGRAAGKGWRRQRSPPVEARPHPQTGAS